MTDRQTDDGRKMAAKVQTAEENGKDVLKFRLNGDVDILR